MQLYVFLLHVLVKLGGENNALLRDADPQSGGCYWSTDSRCIIEQGDKNLLDSPSFFYLLDSLTWTCILYIVITSSRRQRISKVHACAF